MSAIDEIRERWSKATRGPWRWFGNTKAKDLYLATTHSGRKYVMQFERYGMRGAQPCFQVRAPVGGLMTKASELVTYEVRPDPGKEPYRHDVDGIDHPDAIAIASAPEDVRVLLEEIDRMRAALADADERASKAALDHWAAEQNQPSAEVEASERCVHCGVELEVEGDSGHCLSCTSGGQQP